MKFRTFLFLCQGASAFVVQPQSSSFMARTTTQHKPAAVIFSSPNDGEEPAPAAEQQQQQQKSTSFEDAGRAIVDEEDEERLKSMGDFDSNSYSSDSIEKMRAAIQERAQKLGYEKSKVSQQYIEEAKQRAMNNAANRGSGEISAPSPTPLAQSLDLSQISTGDDYESRQRSKKKEWDENLPSMMYDPADDLTEAEQAEADPIGQLPLWQQALEELKESTFPDFGTVLREIGIISGVIAFTAVLIVNWDAALRDFYTGLGMIPSKEQAEIVMEDVSLPPGFTDNMNEDDLAKITEEMNKGTGKASTSSPSVNALLESTNPDL